MSYVVALKREKATRCFVQYVVVNEIKQDTRNNNLDTGYKPFVKYVRVIVPNTESNALV